MSQKLIHIQTVLLALLAVFLGLHTLRQWNPPAPAQTVMEYETISARNLPGGDTAIVTVIHTHHGATPAEMQYPGVAASLGDVLRHLAREGWRFETIQPNGNVLVSRIQPTDPKAWTGFKLRSEWPESRGGGKK